MMKDNWVPRDKAPNRSPMFADTPSVTASNWGAVRSELVVEVLRRENRQRVRAEVRGESMLPALWPGDVVEIESCPREELRPGEIVLAQRDERLVLHRLLAGSGTAGFVLRGDCVRCADPEYPAGALLGRLVRGAAERRDVPEPGRWARSAAEWSGAKWSRAIGILFCYCSLARRVALRLHSRRKALARDITNSKHGGELARLEFDSRETGSRKAGACR
jgi:Peptidase S24-like